MSEISYLPGKEPHPCEHRLIFKNVDRTGWDPSIDCYLNDGGYEQLKKALTMEPSAITNEVKASGLEGPRRSWLSYRCQMGIHSSEQHQTRLPHLQL